jgi:diguanylate cyclase (GGDEF)-like protein
MSDRSPSVEPDPAPPPEGVGLRLAHLQMLLAVSEIVHEHPPLQELLERTAEALVGTVGYEIVVFSLVRPAHDDLQRVVVVHGDHDAAPVGDVRSMRDWAKLLAPRYERFGCFFIPCFDWDALESSYGLPNLPDAHDSHDWDPRDALSVPMRSRDGELLGVMGLDAPVSGKRPTDDQLRLLQAVTTHVAEAIQQVIEAEDRRMYERALERLLAVSTLLTTASGPDAAVLDRIALAISDSLAFERVAIALRDTETGAHTLGASAGWGQDAMAPLREVLSRLPSLMSPESSTSGCFLVSPSVFGAGGLIVDPALAGRRSGSGRQAWRDHVLLAPLLGPGDARLGFVWVGDPTDGCLPRRMRLEALRMFANQATMAMLAHARFSEALFLAEHDQLTGLGNRRALIDRLEQLLKDPSSPRVGLLLLDLDHFKALNDRRGHSAGDRGLASVAMTIEHRLGPGEAAFRLGGDEFAVVMPNRSKLEAAALGRRMERDIHRLEIEGCRLGASVGIAVSPADGDDAHQLLRAADASMYLCKALKRGGVRPDCVARSA